MNRDRIEALLKQVRDGDIEIADALDRLRDASIEELGFATLDLQRALRRGVPEAIYAPGKSSEQVVQIATRLREAGQTVLITRADADLYQVVAAAQPDAEYHEQARAIAIRDPKTAPPERPGVLVLSAGTSDQPVAEEAALTAELMGNDVRRVYDVGVAGLHRLLARRVELLEARVIVAVAGMDGVLPTVVAGLTDATVIGVPTSIGYGTGQAGKAALLGMLNSCAAGLLVVNVDNGYGAGYAAGRINQMIAIQP